MALCTPCSVFGELEEIRSLFLSVEFYSVVGVWGRITMNLSGFSEIPTYSRNERVGVQTLLGNKGFPFMNSSLLKKKKLRLTTKTITKPDSEDALAGTISLLLAGVGVRMRIALASLTLGVIKRGE